MDELTIEQKAKRYDEALERASRLRVQNPFDTVSQMMEYVFPELKESEDERIRKEIVRFIQMEVEDEIVGNKWLAWLEKQGEPKEINPSEFDSQLNRLLGQFKSLPKEELASSLSFYLNVVQNDGTYKDEKQREKKPNPYSGTSFECNGHTWGMCARDNGVEILLDGELKAFLSLEKSFIYPIHPQPELAPKSAMEAAKEEKVDNQNCVKPADKVEAKFKVGDWVVVVTLEGEKVVQINSIEYFESGEPRYITSTGKWFGNGTEAHLWTIQDAKDGDVLATKTGGAFIYKGLFYDKPFAYCGVDKFGVFKDCNCGAGLDWTPYLSEVTPATKEQRDLLFKKMKEASYEWDAEKKELNKIEQNLAECGEEDETSIAINNPESYRIGFADGEAHAKEEMATAWSEEDEEILDGIIVDVEVLKEQDRTKGGKAEYQKEINWLKDLKNRVQPQPKQEWSEEDEKEYRRVEYAIMKVFGGDAYLIGWIRKFKNILLHQTTWKPSEEQMKGIYCAINTLRYRLNVGDKRLNSLYDDLKNLGRNSYGSR